MLNVESVIIATENTYCLAKYQIYQAGTAASDELHLVRACSAVSEGVQYATFALGERAIAVIRVWRLLAVILSPEKLDYAELAPLYVVLNQICMDCGDYVTSICALVEEFAADGEQDAALRDAFDVPDAQNAQNMIEMQPLFARVRPYWDHVAFLAKYRQYIYKALQADQAQRFSRVNLFVGPENAQLQPVLQANSGKAACTIRVGFLVFETENTDEEMRIVSSVREITAK